MKKLFIAAAALMFASCAQQTVADLPLENTCWKLTELNGDENPAFAEGDSFTFKLDGEAITGKGSVNRFFGGYELTEDGLKVGEMGMTRMMGPNVDLEDAYVRMFDGVDNYEINGDVLILTDEGAPVARFKAFEPAEVEETTVVPAGGLPVITLDEVEKIYSNRTEE